MPNKRKQPRAQRLHRIERNLRERGANIVDLSEALRDLVRALSRQRDELYSGLDRVFAKIGDSLRDLDRRVRVLERINGVAGGGGPKPSVPWKH
jgi:hypothetical protein